MFHLDADGFGWLANAFQQRNIGCIGFGERILHARDIGQPEKRIADCFHQLGILQMDHQAVLDAVGKVDHEYIAFIPGNSIAPGSRLKKQEAVIGMPHLYFLLGQSSERRQDNYDTYELCQIGKVSLRAMLAASLQASYREVFSKKNDCLVVLDTLFAGGRRQILELTYQL